MAKTELGIHSYYSPLDAFSLIANTTIIGTVDGAHSPAAGAVGFSSDATGGQQTAETSPRLHEHIYTPSMLLTGHTGGHYGWTTKGFINEYLIPHLSQQGPSAYPGVPMDNVTQHPMRRLPAVQPVRFDPSSHWIVP